MAKFKDTSEGWCIVRTDGAFYQSAMVIKGKMINVTWTSDPKLAKTYNKAELAATLMREITEYENSARNLIQPVPFRMAVMRVETVCEVSE